MADLLNSVAASLVGWVAGPFFVIPIVAVIGRSSVVLWSLVVIFACQVWAALMTGPHDYIPFTISRLVCGFFGGVPAILGSGYIIDMFFLHQRGKAFAIFEVLIIFAVVGGGTLGGFIAERHPWNYVFWWTLGPVGGAILAVFLFVEDTTYPRDPWALNRAPLPKNWFANRAATFLPGTRTQPSNKGEELVRSRSSQINEQADQISSDERLSHSKSPFLPSLSSQAHTSSSPWDYPSCKPQH